MTVRGEGFEPDENLPAPLEPCHWQPHDRARLAGGNGQPLPKGEADAQGRAEFHFNVPDDLGGSHTLSVESTRGKQTGNFWIKPTALPLDVGRGPVGTTFRIHLKGVGWSETANIVHVVYDNSYIGYACAFNSQGDIELIMQATGEPGGISSISILASTKAPRSVRTISGSRN